MPDPGDTRQQDLSAERDWPAELREWAAFELPATEAFLLEAADAVALLLVRVQEAEAERDRAIKEARAAVPLINRANRRVQEAERALRREIRLRYGDAKLYLTEKQLDDKVRAVLGGGTPAQDAASPTGLAGEQEA